MVVSGSVVESCAHCVKYSMLQGNSWRVNSWRESSFLFSLKLEIMLEDNVGLPSNGKLYTKVINWVQRSIWENGGSLEDLMEEVSL